MFYNFVFIFLSEVLHEEKQYASVGSHVPPVGQMSELAPYIVSDSNPVAADETVSGYRLQ